jgi:predicted dehydrogenase
MNSNKMKRIGLIGFGDVGLSHFEAYQSSEKIKVVAVAELNPVRRNYDLLSSDVTFYESHTALLSNEKLDIVCILTPASTHFAIARDCADANVPTLCEKPLAHSLDDATDMRDYFAKANVPLFYGSTYRYLPTIMQARQLIADGAIGSVKLIRESLLGGKGASAQRPYSAVHYPTGCPGGTGMGLVDHGIHLLDIMPWLVGSPIKNAWGSGNRTGEPLATEFACLIFENGAVGHLIYEDGSWPTTLPNEGLYSKGAGWNFEGPVAAGQWDRDPASIHVYGTDGALRICHYANMLFLSNADGIHEVPVIGAPAPDHFRRQLESFIDDLEIGNLPSSSADDGIKALEVLEEIYRSRF